MNVILILVLLLLTLLVLSGASLCMRDRHQSHVLDQFGMI